MATPEVGDFRLVRFIARGGMGVDHSEGIFSLGVVLYELLTLRRPFEGDTTHQVCEKNVTWDPPDPRKLRSQCPAELGVICGKALQKARSQRYLTMADFAADLRRHLANEPIRARPPGAVARAVKWAKRLHALCPEALRGWEWHHLGLSLHQSLMTLQGHKGQVFVVAFSPDGTRIVSGSWDDTLRVWDAATGDSLHTLQGHTGIVTSVAWSPDGM